MRLWGWALSNMSVILIKTMKFGHKQGHTEWIACEDTKTHKEEKQDRHMRREVETRVL